MNFTSFYLLISIITLSGSINLPFQEDSVNVELDFINASDFGFSPNASGMENTMALQEAVDHGGTIIVGQPGTYRIGGTVYIGSNTSLKFGNGVFLKKVNEQGEFSHVILNKGALTKTFDEHISIEDLHIIVNGVDRIFSEVYGLRGQLAFFYIKDLKVEGFRCLDLGTAQFGLHVCTFEDIIINNVIIKGMKDGVHLGRGKRFRVSNGVFDTFDDAIALNAHDYATSNPESGWIEDGVIERCYDLDVRNHKPVGHFCRVLGGSWIDWKPGMEVQQSDAVVSNGRIYRVQMEPDGTVYKSETRPTHEKGSKVLDGINWGVVQEESIYTAGVRNVILRDIFLEKPRTAISVKLEINRYFRAYYPGAEVPVHERISMDNVNVLHERESELLLISNPIDVISIQNSSIRNNKIRFLPKKGLTNYGTTKINISGCTFYEPGEMNLLSNSVENKKIQLKTFESIEVSEGFRAVINPGPGEVIIDSDLSGL